MKNLFIRVFQNLVTYLHYYFFYINSTMSDVNFWECLIVDVNSRIFLMICLLSIGQKYIITYLFASIKLSKQYTHERLHEIN